MREVIDALHERGIFFAFTAGRVRHKGVGGGRLLESIKFDKCRVVLHVEECSDRRYDCFNLFPSTSALVARMSSLRLLLYDPQELLSCFVS